MCFTNFVFVDNLFFCFIVFCKEAQTVLFSSLSPAPTVSNEGMSGTRGKVMLNALNVPSQKLTSCDQSDDNEKSLTNSHQCVAGSKWIYIVLIIN